MSGLNKVRVKKFGPKMFLIDFFSVESDHSRPFDDCLIDFLNDEEDFENGDDLAPGWNRMFTRC